MRAVFSVIVIESNVLLREGLCRILRAAHFHLLSAAPSIDSELSHSVSAAENLLLLIGAGDDHGLMFSQIELFKQKYAAGRVAVVADRYRPSDALAAFRSGANVYFDHSANFEAIVSSLNFVMQGKTIVPTEISSSLLFQPDNAALASTVSREADAASTAETMSTLERAAAPHLSAQERRILQSLVEGNSNKVIARKIDIAEATVKVHLKAILRKIKVHNRTQAAIWAVNNKSHAEPRRVATLNGSGAFAHQGGLAISMASKAELKSG